MNALSRSLNAQERVGNSIVFDQNFCSRSILCDFSASFADNGVDALSAIVDIQKLSPLFRFPPEEFQDQLSRSFSCFACQFGDKIGRFIVLDVDGFRRIRLIRSCYKIITESLKITTTFDVHRIQLIPEDKRDGQIGSFWHLFYYVLHYCVSNGPARPDPQHL
jgi:hypothetical protein